ncbi:MAG TPA: ribose-phosphate diphosphokinase [Ruania sp.]|nr:ribose-phosphate diphosphokinase [Ruania sp.]
MTGITSHGEKHLVLVSGRAHPVLAQAVAEELGIEIVPSTLYDFANGEIYVRFAESVRGADAFVLQSHTAPINEWIMEQLLMVDALKRASVKSITAVMPFYGYARQDKKHRGREPISARLMADMFATAGADRLMSVDLHAAQTQGFFNGPVDHLWAMPILTDYVRTRIDAERAAVVSPDAGRIRVAEHWAAKLGGVPLAFVHKTRDVTRPNQAVANRVVGDVAGRDCILVDDLIDTGGTITEAVKVLKAEGARSVFVAATHGVLSDPAPQRLSECGATEVVITNTVPVPEEKRFEGLTVLSIAPLIGRAIREVFDDGSVTSLFDGNA